MPLRQTDDCAPAGKRRIAYLCQGLSHGGLERVVAILAEGMVGRGHDVFVCCYDREGELAPRLRQVGVRVELLRRGQGLDLGYLWRLTRWMRRLAPDVLHMHNETAMFYGTIAGRLVHVPVLIYTEHDGVFPRSGPSRWMNRRLVKRLTHAVAVSEAVRQQWCREDGIPLARVGVVPNGVPLSPLPAGAEESGGGQGLRIVAVGRLSREKGMDVLLEAFALIRRRLPQATLALVGDGTERPALEQLADRLDLGGSVTLLGFRDDVPLLLGGFDVFVLPSRTEGLPMALLEAMAAGLAVVATRVGGVAEAVEDDVTGLLVPPEDPSAIAEAVIALAGDERRRAEFGRAGREEFRRRFEASAMVDAYAALMVT
jgi:glycosyltransferase involved in cell wall biosynthesis